MPGSNTKEPESPKMKMQATESVCSNCEHQVVNGVACDWQPHYCPFQHHPVKQMLTAAPYIGSMTLPAGEGREYDAVRGID